MKTTLAEYIFMERNDIFKQQETIENATNFFNELKTLYNEIDIENSNNDGARPLNDKHQSNDHKDPEDNKISLLRNTSQSSATTPVKLSCSSKSVDNKEFSKINESSNLQNEDDMFGIISMHGPISSRSKKKNDNYRQDLLRQIEDKKKRKQLEIEREKAADEEIEKKIAQQRLSMYMDYLEERKRGDFIVKCKQIEHDSSLNGDRGQNNKGFVSSGPEKSNLENKTKQEKIKESKVCSESDDAIAASRDFNILANLSEVRKIMQHDHIEMLEKLLELHIK